MNLFDVLARADKGVGGKVTWALLPVVLAPFAIPAYLLFARRRGD